MIEIESLIINNVDYSSYIPYSIKITETLDESLDNIILQLIATSFKSPFKPLTKAKLTLSDGINIKVLYMAVAIDRVSEIITSGKFTHNITLIEETKVLERLQIGGKTVTNPSSRIYKNSQQIQITNFTLNSGWSSEISLTSSNYPFLMNNILYAQSFTPLNSKYFRIVPLKYLITTDYSDSFFFSYQVIRDNKKIYTSPQYQWGVTTPILYSLTENGQYNITYNIIYNNIIIGTLQINFLVVDQIVEYSRFNLSSEDVKIPNKWENPILQNSIIELGDFLNVIPSGDENSFIIESPDGTQQSITGLGQVTLSQLGVYTFYYHTNASGGGLDNQFIMRFNVMTQNQIDNYSVNKTIKEVINTILETYKTLYLNENPEIVLNDDQSSQFSKIESPQFSFTNQMTLWEVFSIIGGYLQTIPRLKDGILYFEELGGVNLSNLNFENYVINESNYSVEQFCSEIVSTVDNLVNYEKDGSIIEPSLNYSTLRTEQAKAYIEEDDLVIRTNYDIEQLVDIEVADLSDGTEVGSIYDFVYEQTEYQCLSSYQDVYPNAKCYAVYWTRGEKNIKGLQFKKPNIISGAFENYAIQNIICKITGKSNDWFSNILGLNNTIALQNLLFRVKYIPRVKSKLKQKKSLIDELTLESQIAYNQNSTLIDTHAYGENMRGVIARLGNVELVRTYIFKSLNELPKVGDIVIDKDGDEYFISNIISEIFPNFIQSQVSFSKNFNRLSEFVGIKNELRFSEVSVDQVIDRFINIDDYCVISDNAFTSDGNAIIKRGAIAQMAASFRNDVSNTLGKITGAIVGTSNDGEIFNDVLLTLSSFGFGNSMVFNFNYQDNFSAGDKIIALNDSVNNVQKVQQQVQYGDYYGEALYIKFGFIYLTALIIVDNNELIKFGNELPDIEDGLVPTFFSTPVIKLNKDNREKINVVYQIHFITNNKNIVIGSALGNSNFLISENSPKYEFYISPNRLRKLATTINTNGMTKVELNNEEISNSLTNTSFNLDKVESPVAGKSWLIVCNNKLVIGENLDIIQGQTITLPTFTFTHKI